jgi:copper chaperone CopZ
MSTLEELPLTVEFAVSGMTCGACAARIQDQLNKIDGVDASVNYATETATVRTRFGVQTDALIHAVEEAGYGAALREADAPVGATEEEFAENFRLFSDDIRINNSISILNSQLYNIL